MQPVKRYTHARTRQCTTILNGPWLQKGSTPYGVTHKAFPASCRHIAVCRPSCERQPLVPPRKCKVDEILASPAQTPLVDHLREGRSGVRWQAWDRGGWGGETEAVLKEWLVWTFTHAVQRWSAGVTSWLGRCKEADCLNSCVVVVHHCWPW